MSLFNKVTIIGIGLIGSFLWRVSSKGQPRQTRFLL